MKKFLKSAAALTLFAGALFAQRPFGPGAGNASQTAPDPAAIVANRVAHLTNLLDLTAAQAAQATSIFTAAITTTSTLHTTLDTNQTNLQTAVKNNAVATIDQLSTAIGAISGQLLAIESKAQASFYATLTATQQAKLTSLGNLGIGGPGGHGGRGGRGGPGFGQRP